MTAVPEHTTVAVIGAGPTGLLLAGDLASAGVDVTVLEQHQKRSDLTRAFVVHARTLEVLDARGLADELLKIGTTLDHLRLFGGGQLDLSWLPSRFPYLLVTPQYNVERLLEERARAAGARLVRGAELVGLRQHDDRVDLDVRTPDGDRRLTAGHVVGADGAHSKVRDALGLPFPGHQAVSSIMLADVRLTNPPEEPLTANAVGDAFAFLAPFGDGWWRVFAWNRHNQLPDSAPVDLDEVREVTHRALGTDLGLAEARWLSRFHSDERQVPQYHVGRVLLAGDAAHVHSPAGGQGMNTGLQDAANLSWKLAATVRGWAPDGLLDTYQDERHPVGRLVLRASGMIIRLALMHTGLAKARNVVTDAALHLSPLAHRASGTLSGIGIDYPDAPRATDLDLTDGGRLYPLLGGVRFVLLTSEAAAPAATEMTGAPAAVTGWAERLTTATPAGHSGPPCTLVRPDGYVAWSGEVADLPQALARHVGMPAMH